MNYPQDKCPQCYSKYRNIRGMVWPEGEYANSRPCEHPWHKGENYDPNVLDLTEDDKKMLREHHISPN